MKKVVMIIAGVLIAILMAWKLASNKNEINKKSQPANKEEVAIPVKVTAVVMKAMKMDIRKTGNIIPFKESKVVTTTAGTIVKSNIELGQTVQRGQVLATLDHDAATLDLQKAEMNAAKLKGDFQTYTELLQGNATTEQKVKDIAQQYNDAQNQVNQIRRTISEASIKAPISGMIFTKDAEQGVYANAGMQIATIVDITKMNVRVNLAEQEVYRVKVGQSVKITSDFFQGHSFEGTVTYISPKADDTHNYTAEIRLDNDPKFTLRAGTFVTVYFAIPAQQEVLVIPLAALIGDNENASAYVINKDRVRLTKIQIGREVDGLIEVRSGLYSGDQVVVSGQINLSDSTRIRISK